MSSEDERVEWLRAQIEGDRALAKRVAARYVAGPGSSREGEAIWPTTVVERAWQEYEDPDVLAGLDFIKAHNPQDVIADCAAKLALLDPHSPQDELPLCSVCITDRHGYPEEWGDDDWPCATVRLLASAYRHRDGYAKHWGAAAVPA